jgi:hypothetical protein
VPYSAACPQSAGARSAEGWLNDGISANGLGRGFKTGGTPPYESFRPRTGAQASYDSGRPRTGAGTLELIAKTHKRFRSVQPEEMDLPPIAEEDNWPAPPMRRASPSAPEDGNGEAKMRRARRQEDSRCRNSAAAPTESEEDAGQVMKPREVGARVV